MNCLAVLEQENSTQCFDIMKLSQLKVMLKKPTTNKQTKQNLSSSQFLG